MVAAPTKPEKPELSKEQRDAIRTAIRAFRTQLKEIGLQESESLYQVAAYEYNELLDLVGRVAEQQLFVAGIKKGDATFEENLKAKKEELASNIELSLTLKRNQISAETLTGPSIKFWKAHKEEVQAFWARFKAEKAS